MGRPEATGAFLWLSSISGKSSVKLKEFQINFQQIKNAHFCECLLKIQFERMWKNWQHIPVWKESKWKAALKTELNFAFETFGLDVWWSSRVLVVPSCLFTRKVKSAGVNPLSSRTTYCALCNPLRGGRKIPETQKKKVITWTCNHNLLTCNHGQIKHILLIPVPCRFDNAETWAFVCF